MRCIIYVRKADVRISFDMPEFTGDTVALEQRALEAVRQENPQTKFYQASSSKCLKSPRNSQRNDSLYPEVHMEWRKSTRIDHINYRESYNMFACSGILFQS